MSLFKGYVWAKDGLSCLAVFIEGFTAEGPKYERGNGATVNVEDSKGIGGVFHRSTSAHTHLLGNGMNFQMSPKGGVQEVIFNGQ